MSGDDTAELRVLDLVDFPGADSIDDDSATAQVLVDLSGETTAKGRATLQASPEKTINIQHGGGLARVRVKLSTSGGSGSEASWSVVRQGGTVAIRVVIEPGLEQLPARGVPVRPEPARTAELGPNCVLWVVLERNQAREVT